MGSSAGLAMHSVVSAGATLLHLGMSVFFLVIAFVYVRPNRPDVWPIVAGWAGASLLLTGLHMAFSSVAPTLAGNMGGTELMLGTMAMVTGTFAILRTGVDCVLAYAIVLLAKGRQNGDAG